jgi:hypothetical protein
MGYRVATATLTVVALAALAAGAASARVHVTNFPTTFHAEYTAEPGGGVFSGELVSVKRKCNPSRKIVVTALGPSGREVIGEGSSDAEGHFEFPALARAHGDLEAEVREKQIPPKSRYVKRVCLTGRAQVLVP